MCPLSNINRSDSSGQTSSDIGDLTKAFTGEDYYQELIGKANTVPILKVLRHYGIPVDAYNRKTTCPFKSHKGGREKTPSFYIYPDTNTFFCFGCKAKSRPCDFVALMDNCTRSQAAHKIFKIFETDVDEDKVYSPQDFEERLRIMLDFSDRVREFYQIYSGPEAGIYVEAACEKFDALNLKKKLTNEALLCVVEDLKKYLSLYGI